MAVVYILYSQKIDSYYVGSCENMARRLIEHNDGINNKSFTHRATDWHVFFSIINLEYQQARLIETHIKKMKSRTYYQNIKKYSDISEKLKEKYSTGSFR